MTESIDKYPRTRHIEGSRLQPGDEDLSAVRLSELRGQHLVIEEKIDGANAGIRFSPEGELRLQSRGHYLTGGYRERHFALLKTWATTRQAELRACLGDRYVVYGEWVYAKHTIFYDALPHYFLEFDVLDTERGAFLSTPARRRLLAGSPLVSVPVVWEGQDPARADLEGMIRPSLYKTPHWRERLRDSAAGAGVASDRAAAETDTEDASEGLYIKAEQGDRVVGRYKFVRRSFLTTVADSGTHWLDRTIIPNRLADGVDLYGS